MTKFWQAVIVSCATIAMAAGLITPTMAGDSAQSHENRISMLKTFINDDNVVLFHNELMDSQRDVLDTTDSPNANGKILSEFVTNLWAKNETALPNLNWQNAMKDQFRISVAALITLGIRDGWIDFDQEIINKYLRTKLRNADDPFVKTMAIYYLGIGGSDEDVVLLEDLSLSKSESNSRAAVTALGMQCSSVAEKALRQVRAKVSGSDMQAWVLKTLDKYYGTGRPRRCFKYRN